jgi:tRNA(Ile)-lysidine synthase
MCTINIDVLSCFDRPLNIAKVTPMTDWSDRHAKLHQALKARLLLPAHSRILVAVSGGQDSLCLLKLLLDLQSRFNWQLGVVHCDHQWRSDATANADHVRSLCHQWDLPCFVETATIPPSGEAAARHWRYACFQQVAQVANYDRFVTGHTATDRAETLLYNLVRGSGSDGLQSLGWVRSLSTDCPIPLVRPLLEFTREETAQVCQDYALPVWEDATNQQVDYARNRIRLEIMPQLVQHLNPRSTEHLSQTAELLTAEVEYLELQAQAIYQQAIDPEDAQRLDRQVLRSAHLALQRRVIRQFLQQHLPQSPNFAQIEAVVGLINAPNRSQTSTFIGGLTVRVVDRYLQFFAS